MIKKLVLSIIVYYQKTLSPDHGYFKDNYPFGYCRYFPTCSQYAYEAINKYGIFWGSIKSFWRIMRCNPFSKGGYDPLK